MGSTFNPLSAVINPQQQQQIASLVQAAQGNGSALPAASPDQVMPGTVQQSALPPTSPFDIAGTFRQLADQPEISGPLHQMDAQRQQIADLAQQRTDMPVPKTGWLDTQGQPQKPGFLHSLARALTAVGAATTPGQAIQGQIYNPGIRDYNNRQQLLADQIAGIKSQAAISESELGKGAQLGNTSALAGYHGAEIGVQQERNSIAKQRSDTQAQDVARQASNDLVRQSQGWQRLSQDQQKVALQQWFQKAEIDVAQQRVNAGMDENSARIQAQQDVQAELAQNKYAMAHPVLGPILQGLGMAPQLTSTPAAQTPKVMAKPTSTTSKPAAKGKTGTYNPDTKQVEWH